MSWRSVVRCRARSTRVLVQQIPRRSWSCFTLRTGQSTNVTELVNSLPQDAPSKEDTALVVLLSRGYTGLAGSGAAPLLERLSLRENPSTVVTAVVDGIAGSATGSDFSEGLSVLRVPPSALSNDHEQTANPNRGVLSFTNPDSHGYEVQLPLAETLFHNGRPWTLSVQTGSTPFADMSRSKINLPSTSLQLDAPFRPLTPARQVVDSFGNIVRRLRSETEGAPHMPASQELEAAVANYFAQQDLSPQPVPVWAIISPRQLTSPLTLLQGGSMHRVLGGGGGWGANKGLVSLDPETTYAPGRDGGSPRDGDESFVEQMASRQTARVGDWVQFVIPDGSTASLPSTDTPTLAFSVMGDADATTATGSPNVGDTFLTKNIFSASSVGLALLRGTQTKIDLPGSLLTIR